MIKTKVTEFDYGFGSVVIHSTSEPQDSDYFASVVVKLGYFSEAKSEEEAIEKMKEFLRTHKPTWVPV